MQVTCIHCIVFKLCMWEKKEERKKKNKIKIFMFDVIIREKDLYNSGNIVYIRIAKAFDL